MAYGYSKYKAKRTQVDGIWFASQKEAKRYSELKLMQQAGAIKNLQLQVPYDIVINGVKITRYVADFVYEEKDQQIVEDSKGYKTAEYKMKRLLMWAVLGIEIIES
jgi:hypothetical protein